MKKKQLYIMLISFIIAALIAASIAVPILIINRSKVPAPTFAEFDQLSDMTILVEWKKVSKAKSYDIEYCYGNPQATETVKVNGTTENTFFSIERKKGVLNVRVRATFSKEVGNYSQYIMYSINPIKLITPIVAISDTLNVSWTEIKYKYYNNRKAVPLYVYDININSKNEDFASVSLDATGTSEIIADIIISYLGGYDYTQENWDDITITVSVKAVNYSKLGSEKITIGDYKFVYDVYNESDYGTSSYTLTLQDYQRIKNIQG